MEDLEEVVNWELHLTREVADRGIRPAVHIHRSGTLRSERLLEESDLATREKWRSTLTGDAIEDAASLQSLAEADRPT